MRLLKFVLTLGVLCSAFSAVAQNVAVGSCKPSLPSFPTIQLAVNSIPVGGTIQVCPGFYPEQVTVNKNLTIKGIAVGNQGAAIVTSPVGGVIQNTVSLATGNPIAAQLLVQAPASSVTVTNITVDGSNNQLSGGCGVPNLIGIYFQNASGTITRTAVLNQALSAGLAGCQNGLGIFAQSDGIGGTSVMTITNNHVEGYQKNGITGNELGTNVTITGNTVIGQGPTTGAAENSIQIGFGAAGNITKNTVGSDVWAPDVITDPGDAAAGILVYASPGIIITSNNVNNTQFGIAVVSADAGLGNANNSQVTKNTVSATHIFDGIDLCSSGNFASLNIVNGSDEAGIHVDSSCGGPATSNSVTQNTINSACAGILSGPGATGATTPNTFFNVGTLHLTGTDVCTPPPSKNKNGGMKQVAHHHAARP